MLNGNEFDFNRRQLLRMGVTSAGATLLNTAKKVQAEVVRPRNYIDAHVHVWSPDTTAYPLADGYKKNDMNPPSFTPEQLMVHAEPTGISKVVLIQMSFYGFDNSYMLDTMKKYPGIYSGVAVIDETLDPAKTMKSLANQGVRGFRIRPGAKRPNEWLESTGMKRMWEYGAEEGLAMCHLIDPNYLDSVAQMCIRYPRTPVVIDHFARVGVTGTIVKEELDALCRLAKFKNVSVKVSAFYALGAKKPPYKDLTPMIRRVFDAYGPQRLMWASDCPFQVQQHHNYKAAIDLVKNEIDFLTDADREWLLRKTAEKVFFN